MIGDLKLSDLIPKTQWDEMPVPARSDFCHKCGLEGKVAGKEWKDLTIQEALMLTGKVCKPNHWLDPLMSPADFDRARQNRESYSPKYPDGKEETDESRERWRAERRAERPVRIALVKKTPVWDPVNMRMVYQ